MKEIEIWPGSPFPAGANATDQGVNFSIFSRHATAVTLLLYEAADSALPSHVIELEAPPPRGRYIWHVLVSGVDAGWYYTWRVQGPTELASGHRFDSTSELIDPFARAISAVLWTRDAAAPAHQSIRNLIVSAAPYDWEGDVPLDRPFEDEIIYEMHVGGFTQHASSNVANRGSFAGVAEKIPYLLDLGITAVELLPVMAFDEFDVPAAVAARGHKNYWGYSTLAYFALHPGYAASADPRIEFQDMVKALHRANIAVILDVAFNHTAEGGATGPTLSFKGLDNSLYYHLDADDLSLYRDYTGCGNTVNCNHPVVADFIVKCLEYWVEVMHVDGFRFDLASVLSRDETGQPDAHARVIWNIEQSPLLRSRVLIAEPWDAVGLHQLGHFPGYAWSEWNDRYRDELRAFLRGDAGCVGDAATRIAGSSDLYLHADKGPGSSVNFFTCHDGFTLFDLVSYNEKHNEINGENDTDGHNHNVSWNSGTEGPTGDADIHALRLRRVRNFMTVLMLSQGVPMFAAGDERLRSQQGNNNAYCQANELSWIDWTDDQDRLQMFRFTRELIAFRKRHKSLRRREFIAAEHVDTPALHWFSNTLEVPNWHDSDAKTLCFRLAGSDLGEPAICAMMNLSQDELDLPLPQSSTGGWLRIVDTQCAAPKDIVPEGESVPADAETYALGSHAIAVLIEG